MVYKDELTEAFNAMENVFTTYEFQAKFAEMFPAITVPQYKVLPFLDAKCQPREKNAKIRLKKMDQRENPSIFDGPEIIEEAIRLLKGNGYKVLKPMNEFIEV
jgi:hypothetical protein